MVFNVSSASIRFSFASLGFSATTAAVDCMAGTVFESLTFPVVLIDRFLSLCLTKLWVMKKLESHKIAKQF